MGSLTNGGVVSSCPCCSVPVQCASSNGIERFGCAVGPSSPLVMTHFSSYHEHWAVGVPHHSLGHTSQQDSCDAVTAMTPRSRHELRCIARTGQTSAGPGFVYHETSEVARCS